jgi:hypothetical protein
VGCGVGLGGGGGCARRRACLETASDCSGALVLREGRLLVPRLVSCWPALPALTPACVRVPALLPLEQLPPGAPSRGAAAPGLAEAAAEQLPVEIPLGREFVFHSVFACPVSRDQVGAAAAAAATKAHSNRAARGCRPPLLLSPQRGTANRAARGCRAAAPAMRKRLSLSVTRGCLSCAVPPLSLGWPASPPPCARLPVYEVHSARTPRPASPPQSTPDNPPLLLPCGHCICKASILRIAKAPNRSFKCPYCPAECTPKDCQQLVFPDME